MHGLFLLLIILKISKLNVGVLFHTWGFRSSEIPLFPPPQGENPGDPRITKWEKLEYGNTMQIQSVIVFYKTFLKILKNKLLKKQMKDLIC